MHQNKKFNIKKSLITKAVVSALTLSSFAATAEEEQSTEATAAELDIITVTAQKRVQNVMEVPITVGAVSADTIEETGSITLSDIDKFIPGFEFDDGNMTQAGITMRGISSPNISVGGDPSSASFYDDIYMPRAAQNVIFSDMGRVEVLKGPQGTLFGRNAAMGVVNMVPNSPTEDFEGFVKGTFGTDELQRYEGMVNVPLTDSFYMRANALWNMQGGIVDNVADPAWNDEVDTWDLGERDHKAGRLSFLWEMSSATDFQLSYDFDDLAQAPPMAIGLSEYAYNGGQDIFGDKAANDVRNGIESRDMHAVTFKMNHAFSDEWSMKYVASYRAWETEAKQDEDGTADARRYLDTNNIEDSNIFYTELQVNYVSDRINAVTGFSYSKEDVSQTTELNVTSDTIATLVTGELNSAIDGVVQAGVAGQLGLDINTATQEQLDAAASAAFGPDVTFQSAVAAIKDIQGIEEMEHMWNPDEWSGTINALDAAAPELGLVNSLLGLFDQLGIPHGGAITPELVAATGNLTYDAISTQVPALVGSPNYYMPEVFGPGFGGLWYQETVSNTGDFTNWGVFADVDFAITDKWNVIGGIRYSNDNKKFTWDIPLNSFATVPVNSLIAAQGLPPIPIENLLLPEQYFALKPFGGVMAAEDSWDKITGRLVTSYKLNDDEMIFASYSTGYKSGGYDSLDPQLDANGVPQAFDPEDTANFELGYKAVLWEQVVANISGYYLQLSNQQVSVSSKEPGDTAAVPRIISIDRDLTGFEFDLRWMATDSLTLGVITEIRSTDSHFPEYYNSTGDLIEAQTTSSNAALNYTLTLDFMPDFGVGTTNFHMDYVFQENTNASNPGLEDYLLAIPEYFVDRQDLNMRLSWANDDDNIEIGLWGKNLLDKDYLTGGGGLAASELGTPVGRINRGLEAGIDLKYSF
ncbi:Outer membrane receptor for ferric coprogen and ferric-rhodotorulic acid [Thalassotalea agarivorans]|uniref:Outer membrane receptor for ferric coprogen and ferric-rhodotorulic acid n=2 Tax=Thalassotalea agarivorans TaxID=349064 RepID=A0A1I0FVJ9_THASX|nr:Outer membrane receptor for ferric coprogen and ferric-rhodotorulic acid [Thalassotalea agarivorans]